MKHLTLALLLLASCQERREGVYIKPGNGYIYAFDSAGRLDSFRADMYVLVPIDSVK